MSLANMQELAMEETTAELCVRCTQSLPLFLAEVPSRQLGRENPQPFVKTYRFVTNSRLNGGFIRRNLDRVEAIATVEQLQRRVGVLLPQRDRAGEPDRPSLRASSLLPASEEMSRVRSVENN